jgi:outer membrane protein assembly factor BamC
VLWPQLKQFWEDSGFTIAVDQPTAGIMETEWNETAPRFRRTSSATPSARPSIRCIRAARKTSSAPASAGRRLDEIYISHRGVQEVVTGRDKETTKWTPRPNDPGLEAQFLAC